MTSRRPNPTGEAPPLLCALLLALLFASMLADRAGDRDWRRATDDAHAAAASVETLTGPRAAVPAALADTRYVARLGEPRVRLTAGALSAPAPSGLAALILRARPTAGRAATEAAPQSRFRVCGYHAAPPTAPPPSAPIS